jgi:hypothetical protein
MRELRNGGTACARPRLKRLYAFTQFSHFGHGSGHEFRNRCSVTPLPAVRTDFQAVTKFLRGTGMEGGDRDDCIERPDSRV